MDKAVTRGIYWCLFDFDSESIKGSFAISVFGKISCEFSLTMFKVDGEDVIGFS